MSSVSVDYCDTNLGKVTFSTLLPQRLTIILGIKMFKNVNNILYVCYTAQRNTRFQKWSKSWHEVATGGRQSAKAFFFFFYWRKWNGPRVNKEWIKTCVFFIVRPSSSSSSSFSSSPPDTSVPGSRLRTRQDPTSHQWFLDSGTVKNSSFLSLVFVFSW